MRQSPPNSEGVVNKRTIVSRTSCDLSMVLSISCLGHWQMLDDILKCLSSISSDGAHGDLKTHSETKVENSPLSCPGMHPSSHSTCTWRCSSTLTLVRPRWYGPTLAGQLQRLACTDCVVHKKQTPAWSHPCHGIRRRLTCRTQEEVGGWIWQETSLIVKTSVDFSFLVFAV